MANALSRDRGGPEAGPRPRPAQRWTPRLVIAPSAVASFVYVFVFTLWTFYISLSEQLAAADLRLRRPQALFRSVVEPALAIAYSNLFFFSAFYVVLAMVVGLALAIAIDQRVRAKRSGARSSSIRSRSRSSSPARSGAGSTAPTPASRFRAQPRLDRFHLPPRPSNRETAIYTIIATGIWQSSGFAMALFLAGLRSVDPDLVKAAQIDGAGPARIYRKVILPSIAPIFIAVAVVLLQFAIKTFDLVVALTQRRTRHLDHLPGDLCLRPDVPARPDRHRRRGVDHDAAALAVVLVPYALWIAWRARRRRGPWLTPTYDADLRSACPLGEPSLCRRPRRDLRLPWASSRSSTCCRCSSSSPTRSATCRRSRSNGLIAIPHSFSFNAWPKPGASLRRRHLRGHPPQFLQFADDDDSRRRSFRRCSAPSTATCCRNGASPARRRCSPA